MQWEIPSFSAGEIKRAGEALARGDSDKEALMVAENWRASHAYPLYEITGWLQDMFPDHIIAQRLKRMESIVAKLRRSRGMSLWRMQDLGGCRIIVDSIEEVYAVIEKIKANTGKYVIKRETDYILSPRASGYRSYHMILEYHGVESYDRNMLVELQVRTKLEHMWATAVEIMGVLQNESFKSGVGDESILDFFRIASALFGEKEGFSLARVGEDRDSFLKEARRLDFEKDILARMNAMRQMIKIAETDVKAYDYCVLILDKAQYTLKMIPFKVSDITTAIRLYESMEQISGMDAVLIRTEKFADVYTAYPNYFVDAADFIREMEDILYK